MTLPSRHWADLTTDDFARGDVARWIAVLPIAAIEQHGPHLPTGTDTTIGAGLIEAALQRLPDDLPALALPLLPIGKSDEHQAFPGTLSLSAETMIAMLVEIGASVARAGLRKLLIVSSHGGNSEVMGIAARRLRLELGMLVVATSWARLGYPEGLFAGDELEHGIHGGAVETALMRHLAPGAVREDRVRRFPSRGEAMAGEHTVLRATGRTGFAWATEDLNPDGACGDAAAGTAAAGAAAAEFAVERLIALIADIDRFAPPWLDEA